MHFNCNGAAGSTAIYKNLGTGTSFNIKALYPEDYQKFTLDNFVVEINSFNMSGSSRGGAYGKMYGSDGGNSDIYVNSSDSSSRTIAKSYTNGIFTVSNLSGSCGASNSQQSGSIRGDTEFNCSTNLNINVRLMYVES